VCKLKFARQHKLKFELQRVAALNLPLLFAEIEPKMQLKWLDLVVIAGYFFGMLMIGVVTARRQTSTDMYFLGGRRVHWFLAGVSVVATLLSTLSYLAVPGEVIKHGLGMFSQLIAFILIIPFVNWIVIPAVMRLPVTSVYDYLERRYSRQARTLGASVFVLTRTAWIGMILFSASEAISVMTGWTTISIIIVMGVVTTLYTTSGGLEGVIWSDFAQFLILFGGAIIIPLYIGYRTEAGPLAWWQTFEAAGRANVPIMSFDPTVRVTLVGVFLEVFFWNVCTHLSDQVAVQRYLSTPSIKSARRSMWVFSIGNVGLILLLVVCGIALFFFYSQQAESPAAFQELLLHDADKLMPRFMAEELPAGVTGLLLAALLAAAMSSISSGINSISTVISSDFLAVRKSQAKKTETPAEISAEDHEDVRMGRVLAVVTGTFGIGMAWVVLVIKERQDSWNLLEMIARLNHLFVAPLGAIFLAGILMRRVGASAALIGFAAGTATSFLISFSGELFKMPTGTAGEHISFMWIMPCSFLVSLLVTYMAGFFLPAPSSEQIASLSSGRSEIS
jgi:solute:Na+ symporter, SSS family